MFYLWMSSYPAPFVEDFPIPIELPAHPGQKSIHHIYVGLFLEFTLFYVSIL